MLATHGAYILRRDERRVRGVALCGGASEH